MVKTNEREGSESVSYIADLSNEKIKSLLDELEKISGLNWLHTSENSVQNFRLSIFITL